MKERGYGSGLWQTAYGAESGLPPMARAGPADPAPVSPPRGSTPGRGQYQNYTGCPSAGSIQCRASGVALWTRSGAMNDRERQSGGPERQSGGLLTAWLLDGKGGGVEVGWDAVRSWTPDRGRGSGFRTPR